MLLCLSDANHQTVSSELKKKLTESQTFRLSIEMRNYAQCEIKSMYHKFHGR